jgi:hypothetical protein
MDEVQKHYSFKIYNCRPALQQEGYEFKEEMMDWTYSMHNKNGEIHKQF